MRLDELIAAYAMLARGGEFVRPALVKSIDGRIGPAAHPERVLSPRTAFWITDILADAGAREYIFGRGGSLEFPFTVAAKTGTSQAYHDNWTLGYTRDVTVGVWVGNFDRTPLQNSSGVTGAGPIFHDVMLAAVEKVRGSLPIGDDDPILAPTGDVRRVQICATSGMTPTTACPTRAWEWAPAETARAACSWHHESDGRLITVWPEAYRHWARTSGLAHTIDSVGIADTVQASHVGRVQGDATSPLTIVQPLSGAVYLLDPTLRSEFQTLALRARGGAPGTLDWFVDGKPVGAGTTDVALRWPLTPGAHIVTVRDAASQRAETRVVVR